MPKEFLKGRKNPEYPIQISISVEPMRIHHWSYDKVKDYQQDIIMKEYADYRWKIDKSDVNGINERKCWCLDLDLSVKKGKGMYLKLLRLAPNVTRILVEYKLKCKNWKWKLDGKGKLEFTFTNDKMSCFLGDRKVKEVTRKVGYDTEKDTVINIEVRIVKVYVIKGESADDFEYGNDKELFITKWRQYGIV